MTNLEILTAFELEINKLDDVLTKPATDDSLFWINQAISKFIKLRFNGDFVHHTGFEQTEKRRVDLIHLLREEVLEPNDVESYTTYDVYPYEYPEDFLYVLNERVVISDLKEDNKYDTGVFECTRDNFMYRINNSLTDFHYRFHKARPLRIRTADGCELLTDKNYLIQEYKLGYIKTPTPVSLEDPYETYKDFEDTQLYEIIKMAAQMYLENKKDERYQTISNEINTQE